MSTGAEYLPALQSLADIQRNYQLWDDPLSQEIQSWSDGLFGYIREDESGMEGTLQKVQFLLDKILVANFDQIENTNHAFACEMIDWVQSTDERMALAFLHKSLIPAPIQMVVNKTVYDRELREQREFISHLLRIYDEDTRRMIAEIQEESAYVQEHIQGMTECFEEQIVTVKEGTREKIGALSEDNQNLREQSTRFGKGLQDAFLESDRQNQVIEEQEKEIVKVQQIEEKLIAQLETQAETFGNKCHYLQDSVTKAQGEINHLDEQYGSLKDEHQKQREAIIGLNGRIESYNLEIQQLRVRVFNAENAAREKSKCTIC